MLTKHIDSLILQYYQSGKRLHIPNGCPSDIYRLILECWDMDPYRRKKPQAIMRDVNQILYQGIVTRLFQGLAILIHFLLLLLLFLFFFTVVPCILILSKSFVYQLMHNRVALKEY